jgi:hypothetical protein
MAGSLEQQTENVPHVIIIIIHDSDRADHP